MLMEWLKHRLIPAPPEVKALGYLKELIAIEARHQRCASAWGPHLAKTKRFVLWAAANMRAGAESKKVTILGSGLLLDLPLPELAQDFDEVVLVDIVHVPAAREKVVEFQNVRLVEADLTGLMDHLTTGTLPEAPPLPCIPDGDADLVISLNLLTQLTLTPLASPAMAALEDEARTAFAQAIMRRHLEALSKLSTQVAVVTEMRRRWLEGTKTIHQEDPLMGLRLPDTKVTWEWNLAPKPEIAPTRDLVSDVVAYDDLFRKWTLAAP